jgi:hypothetical protein
VYGRPLSILVRLVAGGRVLPGALADLSALPDDARVALRRVLAVRALAPSPTDESRIDACTNIATLERWHDRALVAQSAAQALHTKGRTPGPRRRATRSS